MGNMVNVSILTDYWHTIKNNPEQLVEAIDEGMISGSNYPYGYSSMQGVQVHPYHHASDPAVYVEERNLNVQVGKYTKDWDKYSQTERGRQLLRDAAEMAMEKARGVLEALEGLPPVEN